MKNFSKLLALSVALSLVFGMTALADDEANPSVSISNSNVTNTTLANDVKNISSSTTGVIVSAANVGQYDEAVRVATGGDLFNEFAAKIADVLDAGAVTSVDVVAVFELTGTGTITLSGFGNKIEAGATYVMGHMVGQDNWTNAEMLPVTVNTDGSITFTTSSNSVFTLLKVAATAKDDDDDDDDDDAPAVTAAGAPASPKTGETLPVAGIAMMIALAGAAVCATKVRYNN